jgi:hypothetical protein
MYLFAWSIPTHLCLWPDVFSPPRNQVQIITRGTRSLGYGFVEFANFDDAQKAAQELDKTQIAERTVNVEIAKPPAATGKSLLSLPRRTSLLSPPLNLYIFFTQRAMMTRVAAPAGGVVVAVGAGAVVAQPCVLPSNLPTPSQKGLTECRSFSQRGRGRGGRAGRSGDEAEDTAGAAEETEAKPNGTNEEQAAAAGPNGETRGRGGKRGRGSRGGAATKRTGPPTGNPSKTLL